MKKNPSKFEHYEDINKVIKFKLDNPGDSDYDFNYIPKSCYKWFSTKEIAGQEKHSTKVQYSAENSMGILLIAS